MKQISIIMLAALLLAVPLRAEEAVEREMEQDVVLRALVDELERNKAKLELEDLERPYFIEYSLMDFNQVGVSADLGALTSSGEGRARWLSVNLRVGSYELDNTNFSDDRSYYYGGFRGRGGASIPIEDDYNAIRQAVWWATDREYKNTTETFERKKAFMEGKMIEDKPNDFSRESPSVYFEEHLEPSIDRAWLEEIALTLSNVFRDYPDIQDSGASVNAAGGNKYLVNSEGTRLRSAGTHFAVSVNASVQADDGMELSDSFYIVALPQDELPSLDELCERCHKLAKQLIAVKNAPRLEEAYTGPVLFEPEAAVSVFSSHLVRNFAGGQRPVGSRTSPDDFANKLDKRILPRFLNIVDDPTQKIVGDMKVLGHYAYDDQGVPARPVSLVENGRLKTLLMSRNPSKEFSQSNGHGRGSYTPNAAVACLIVSADPGSDEETLKEELVEACQDEGLEFGLRIATLGSAGGGRYRGMYGSGRSRGTNPLVMYKVYPDGHEELVRGSEIARIDLKAFKRALAAGEIPYVMNNGGWAQGNTIAAPAFLFEELDLARIDRDFDQPPILPNPVAR